MEPDEAALSQKYDFVKLAVHSSTQISSRTGAVISKLGAQLSDGKPVIVALTAKAKCINKLVSVVEVAKRELAASGTKVFQYNTLKSEMVQVARESNQDRPAKMKEPAAENESDDAFETMEASEFSGNKMRAMPVMTTYLSMASVRELKTAYGEQR